MFFMIQIPALSYTGNTAVIIYYSIDYVQIVGVTDVAEASPDLRKTGLQSADLTLNKY